MNKLSDSKVVLFGSTGYVGGKFKEKLPKSLQPRFDLTDYESVRLYLSDSNPDFVINCAGFTGKPNVDQCEEPNSSLRCIDGNVKIPLNIANACQELGIKFGHVSSGCIYSGSEHQPFDIDDEPNFSGSFYAKTKAFSEKVIENKDVYIWRLRIPFDEFTSPRNYITKILTYDKVFGAANSLSHLGDFVNAALESFSQEPRIFNLTNVGYLEFGEVLDILREFQPELSKNLVQIDFPKLKAERSNCVLVGDPLMRPVREAFIEAVKKYS